MLTRRSPVTVLTPSQNFFARVSSTFNRGNALGDADRDPHCADHPLAACASWRSAPRCDTDWTRSQLAPRSTRSSPSRGRSVAPGLAALSRGVL
jgi:hypothetical protein